MQNNATTTPAPLQFLDELTGWDITELREYLNVLFTSYVISGEWKDATKEWKDQCIVAHRVLCRSLDAVQEWDEKRTPEPVG